MRQAQGGVEYVDYDERVKVLSYFDPVVSTSYSLGVARRFGRDNKNVFGYVLILNDNKARHCSSDKRKTANCFFYQEDYYDELEYPFWGYATSSELNGFIADELYIEKNDDGLLIDKRVQVTKGNACPQISMISWKPGKQAKIKKLLLDIYQCN